MREIVPAIAPIIRPSFVEGGSRGVAFSMGRVGVGSACRVVGVDVEARVRVIVVRRGGVVVAIDIVIGCDDCVVLDVGCDDSLVVRSGVVVDDEVAVVVGSTSSPDDVVSTDNDDVVSNTSVIVTTTSKHPVAPSSESIPTAQLTQPESFPNATLKLPGRQRTHSIPSLYRPLSHTQ